MTGLFLIATGAVLILVGCSLLQVERFRIDEQIKSIDYQVNVTLEEKFSVIIAAVYLMNQDNTRVALEHGGLVSINGTELEGESYNNGIATGYKYKGTISKADRYQLIIKRKNLPEVKKEIFSVPFNLNPPQIFSKTKDLEVPFEGLDGSISLTLSSADDKSPVTLSDKYQRSVAFKPEITNRTLRFSSTNFEDLKEGNVKFSISLVDRQSDGVFVVSYNGNGKVVGKSDNKSLAD